MVAAEGESRDEHARRRDRQRWLTSSLALLEVAADGTIVDWNPRAEAVFGWPAVDIVGRSFVTLVPAEGRAEALAGLPLVLRGEQPYQRWVCVRRDGSTIACELHHTVLRDEQGAPLSLVCEVRDVTAAEAQLRRLRLLEALADHSPLGIFAKGPDGRHLYANAAFAASLGRTPAEVVGVDDFALFDAGIAADLRRNDAEIAAAGQVMTREDSGVGPHADRTYWTLKFPLIGEDGALAAICGIINDVSERRQAERARAELQARVIAAQQALLVELSSPLIPLADGVLALPIIGTVDAARAEQIVATLLAGVAEQRARTVILDITGVRTIDADVAAALLRAARAVRLLGAEPVLTGVTPDVARTLVELGVDMGGLTTLASLRSGIEHARRR